MNVNTDDFEHSDNTSEDKELLYENVRGYQFEPEYSQEELNVMRFEKEKRVDEAATVSSVEMVMVMERNRTESTFWCTCNSCSAMPTTDECVCCHEDRRSIRKIDEFDPETRGAESVQKCITEHSDLGPHINRGVLTTFFKTNRVNWKKFPKPKGPNGCLTNSQYRLVAYRHVLEWLLDGEKLGAKKRVPLPACIVMEIRKKYPSPTDEYSGFKWNE